MRNHRGFNKRRHPLLVALALAMLLPACTYGTESHSVGGSQYVQEASPTHREGAIAVTCGFSHREAVDPIRNSVSEQSHMHDFFGVHEVGKSSTADSLLAQDSTCISPADRSSYWVPTMYTNGQHVRPQDMAVYLTAPAGVDVDDVVVPPNGLQLITFKSAWSCARNGVVTPRPETCGRNAVTRLILEFPHCWDGKNLTFSDDDPHVVAAPDECPITHPIVLPRIVMEVRYDIESIDNVTFSSGDLATVHGDAIVVWHQDQLERDINACLRRGVLCGLTWSTEVGA